MGGGNWAQDTYTHRAAVKKAAGKTTFDHDAYARRTGDYTVHADLDPRWTAGPASPLAGQKVREARDSDEHPNSLPIAVLFDVTGSMGSIPMTLQKKLPKLMTLLLQKGYVEDPQILFGAIGDANTDQVPLQVGQFESDNRMDDNLENFILEGNGGGQTAESYALGAYFMARHTVLDSLEKRGKKGYLFIIGDERNYDRIRKQHIADIVGDGAEQDVLTRDVFAEVQEKYETFFLFASQGSYREAEILPADAGYGGQIGWRALLGERALVLDDADAVCEMIASTIALCEGVAELDDVLDDLTDLGTDKQITSAVGKALATVGAGSSAVATADGDLPDLDGDSGADRL